MRFVPSHFRTEKPVFHVSINPHPDDKLMDSQLTDIGREYMEKLDYGNQPYLVFKHEDIDGNTYILSRSGWTGVERRLMIIMSISAAKKLRSNWKENMLCIPGRDRKPMRHEN